VSADKEKRDPGLRSMGRSLALHIVRSSQPRDQFGIDLLRVADPHAMGDHRIPSARQVEAAFSRYTLQFDADVEPLPVGWMMPNFSVLRRRLTYVSFARRRRRARTSGLWRRDCRRSIPLLDPRRRRAVEEVVSDVDSGHRAGSCPRVAGVHIVVQVLGT
jgi:hypothetical protein